MNVDELIRRIASTPGCTIRPPAGLPDAGSYRLPSDVEAFYRECGGCVLYEDSQYPFHVVEPHAFRAANPIIVGESDADDISASWYIVGHGRTQEFVTIDLALSRAGRCYDSFWDRHAVAGSSSIIALSFTDLLERMYDNRGQYWYWLQPSFESLGDAYDDAPAPTT